MPTENSGLISNSIPLNQLLDELKNFKYSDYNKNLKSTVLQLIQEINSVRRDKISHLSEATLYEIAKTIKNSIQAPTPEYASKCIELAKKTMPYSKSNILGGLLLCFAGMLIMGSGIALALTGCLTSIGIPGCALGVILFKSGLATLSGALYASAGACLFFNAIPKEPLRFQMENFAQQINGSNLIS